jgi:hypothetical protein
MLHVRAAESAAEHSPRSALINRTAPQRIGLPGRLFVRRDLSTAIVLPKGCASIRLLSIGQFVVFPPIPYPQYNRINLLSLAVATRTAEGMQP